MIMRYLLVTFLFAGSLASACASAPPPLVTPAQERFAASTWSDHVAGELTSGRQLFMTKCSACHRPPAPSVLKPAEWPEEVADMGERGSIPLSDQRLIERYLVSATSVDPAEK